MIVESLANHDEVLADLYLSEGLDAITTDMIDRAVRNSIKSGKAVPLLCGSSLKNKGVQPLLDAVIKYLPSPDEVSTFAEDAETGTKTELPSDKKGPLCALAFKVVNDKDRGMVTFFRVYSGTLKNKMKIKNATLNQPEKISALLRVKADETQQLTEIGIGDIGAIVGCKGVRSGDTIIEDETQSESRLVLPGVMMPPPVFFCTIEAENSREQK